MIRPARLFAVGGWLAVAAIASGPDVAEAQPDGGAFEFSGVQRSRYETIDEQFGNGLSGADHVLALQTSLLFDLKLEKLQLFGEIMDSRGELNDENSAVGTFLVNTLEPIQAYAAWTLPDSLQEGGYEHLARGPTHARHRQAAAHLPQPIPQHGEHLHRRGLAVARARPAKTHARSI